MSPSKNILVQGFHRGLAEFRHSIPMIFNYVFFPSIALCVMYFLRGYSAGSSGISIGYYAIPGIISMNILFTGMMGIASTLMSEREDGTLMRLRSIPFGTRAYFVGKVISQALLTMVAFIVVLVVSLILFDGLFPNGLVSLVSLLWALPLGIVALIPFGITFGALLPSPRHLSFISLFLLLMTAMSGIFYPLAEQNAVLQLVGQSSPLYWMGHILRFSMLPVGAETAEIGGHWNIPEAALVLVFWAIVGSALGLSALKKISPYPPSSRSRRG